jgi:hypothetical protein
MMIGETERNIVLAQQIEDRIVVPTLMAEFERIRVAVWQHAEERREPLAIYGKPRRQLK